MLHNALTSYPKLLAAFRRALGETSTDFTGIERAGESLTPVLDLWTLPEWAILRGEIIFSRIFSIAADAATFSSFELVNPSTSGVLVTVLEISAVVSTPNLSLDSGAALGAVATTRGLANDARYPNLGEVSQATIVAGHLAAGTALPQDFIVQGTRTSHPYILQPGKKLFLSTQAINTQLTGSFLWTERPLLPGESGV